MTLDELLLNVKDVSFETVVCQTSIQTEADKAQYAAKGYVIPFTEAEFKEECDSIDPSRIYYSPSVSFRSFYYNPETLAICNFNVDMLQLSENMANWMVKAAAEVEAMAQAGDYAPAITCLPDRMRLEFFAMLCHSGKASAVTDLYRQFMDAYVISDYGFRDMDEAALQTIFQSKTEEDRAETQKALADLPETLVIYRGGNSKSQDYRKAYSWTLDVNTANFFASRRGTGEGYIAKAKVRKCDVIDAFLEERGNGEQEIIVDPKTLHIVEVIPVRGLAFLEEILPHCLPIYHQYRAYAEELGYPAEENRDHGLLHINRILLLTQILGHMMNLSQWARTILANAAIYHDIGRTDDSNDPFHGERSAKFYQEHDPNPSKAVALLCKYHCLPDETGYYDFCKDVYDDPQFRCKKTTMIAMYQVLKDADALDRVRFGLHDLDLNQLRLEHSKELGTVARLLYEQIR